MLTDDDWRPAPAPGCSYVDDDEDASPEPEAEAAPETAEQAFDRLARLSPAEYDMARKAEADRLGIRTATLDDEVKRRRKDSSDAGQGKEIEFKPIVPWGEPVDGAKLIGETIAFIRRHVVVDGRSGVIAMALWAMHAHAHRLAEHSPLLAISSPEKRCGKSTSLEVEECLVPKPLQTSNITIAAVFRTIEKWSPTLLVDEADTFLKGDELRGVLNSGHRRSGAFVIRTVGDDHDPRQFATWSPKAIATIGRLPETLADRAIEIRLRRRLRSERVERITGKARADGAILARKMARFIADIGPELVDCDPKIPAALNDRAADNWRQIFAIVDVAGGDWPRLARDAALELSASQDDTEGTATQLLVDIKAYFDDTGLTKVKSEDLAAHLGRMETRPWPEISNGKPITPMKLSSLLKPFEIQPQRIYLAAEATDRHRGYEREWFEDAFSRYLP